MTEEINWQLLDEALDWIEANPQRWDQRHYLRYNTRQDENEGNLCGTNLCLAGTVCHLADRIRVEFQTDEDGTWTDTYAGTRVGFAYVAQELLGLTYEQRSVIFGSCAPSRS
jgi:hypothetical protein